MDNLQINLITQILNLKRNFTIFINIPKEIHQTGTVIVYYVSGLRLK
jgi:hypothetical protein